MISGHRTMKILIVKLSAIGDVIHTLPALDLLHKKIPDGSITWVVEEKAAGIVLGHPHLHKVIVSKRKQWLKNLSRPARWLTTLREVIAFIGELRQETYDLVIDFQGLFKSALLVMLSRGIHTVGYDKTRELSYLVLRHRMAPLPADAHAVNKNITLVKHTLNLASSAQVADTVKRRALPDPCPVENQSTVMSAFDGDAMGAAVMLGEKDERSVDALLRSCGVDPARPLVLINAPAGWETKRWDAQRTAAVADRLISRYGAHIMYTGSGADSAFIDGIIARMRHPAINAAGRTSLKELACLIKRAQLMITTDSGPMHLAATVGAPIVAVFGPTAPWRTGPCTTRAHIVRKQVPCSPCYRRRCDSMLCMREIEVDDVMEAAGLFMGASCAAHIS